MTVLIVAVVGLLSAAWAFARPTTLARFAHSAETTAVSDSISVIVPARNEASSLPTLLDALQRQTVRPTEIIVVDDSSTDDTAAIAVRGGARLITAEPLPAGWAGKPWACATGAAAASGDVMIFLDADTSLLPEAIGMLAAVRARRGGLCSVQPFHVTRRPYEQLSAMFNASAVLGTGHFAPLRRRQAIAFGPCMITGRADYQHVGGHEAVRSSVIEDIALAQAYGDHGLGTTCVLGGEVVRFRMYPDGLRSLVQGWTKNIAMGARQAFSPALVASVVWIAAMAWVAAATIGGVIRWAAGGSVPTAQLVAWALVAAHLAWVLSRLGDFSNVTAALFVVPLVVFIAIFMRSALLVALGRPVRWRGRSISTRSG